MGFYDYRCLVTGVSLKGAKTALVLLEEAQKNAFVPIALAISGSYNRLGSIDGIKEDANTDVVGAFFEEKLDSGELVVDEAELESTGMEDIESLLALIERCVTESPATVVLQGKRICYALICHRIWAAISASNKPSETPLQLYGRVFADSPVGQAIYKGRVSEVGKHLREFAAVSDFLRGRGLPWTPPKDAEQHYGEEMRQFLAEARQSYHDQPAVLAGLDKYEADAGDLLEDG